ncbi:MAG: glycosyltransferase [Nitrospirota bacterium]
MSALVTVVIPAYNHADYVAECITSVLEQDYPGIELVVINDGSTDDTDAVIRRLLGARPSAFHYIAKENEGLVKTLNLALRRSSGEYFCQVASDDLLLPGSIAARAGFLDAHPEVDAVFADLYVMEGTVKTTSRPFQTRVGYDSIKHNLGDLLGDRARLFFASGMIRRSILDRLGGFDEDFRYYEDLSLRGRLALAGRIAHLNEPVMYRRMHARNTSKIPQWFVQEKMLALEKILEDRDGRLGPLREEVSGYLFKEYLRYCRMALELAKDDAAWLTKAGEVLDRAAAIKPYSMKRWYYRGLWIIQTWWKTGRV